MTVRRTRASGAPGWRRLLRSGSGANTKGGRSRPSQCPFGQRRLDVAFGSCCLLSATDHVLGLATNGTDTRTHALFTLIDQFTGTIRQIARAIYQVVAGFFAAHRGKQHAQTDADSKSNEKTFHAEILQLNFTGFPSPNQRPPSYRCRFSLRVCRCRNSAALERSTQRSALSIQPVHILHNSRLSSSRQGLTPKSQKALRLSEWFMG